MNNRTRKIFLIFGFILLTIFGVIRLYFQESDLPAEGALEMPSLHADVEVLTDSTDDRFVLSYADHTISRFALPFDVSLNENC